MTATGQNFGNVVSRTMSAITDLTSKIYYFVNLDTSNDEVVAIAANATKVPFVLMEDGLGTSTAPKTVSIALSGRVKVVLGGTVAAGDKLTSDANGKAITTVTNKDNYGAIALHAGVAGDIVEVWVEQGMISS